VGSGNQLKLILACTLYLFIFIKTDSDVERTGFKGAIYADPTRSVYHALGMNMERLATTPANEKKRSYIRENAFSNILSSIWVPIIRSVFFATILIELDRMVQSVIQG